MYITPYQTRAVPKSNFRQRPQCGLQRILAALGVAMFVCLPRSWANVKDQETEPLEVRKPAPEAPATKGNSSAVDTSLAPVIIEGERLYPEASFQQKFGAALGPPPVLIAIERQFTDGTMQVTTRFGHFCAKPLPGYLQSGIGGTITLVPRCAWY